MCVYHRGVPVVDVWAGTADEAGRPWQRDTMAMSFSTTKGVIATLVHVLAERGLLDYDAPVAEYWPEFAQRGKDRLPLRALLTHQSGLHLIPPQVARAEYFLDWEAMCAALAAAPASSLEAASAYQANTFGWLVGEVIRRVTGTSVGQCIATELATPLAAPELQLGAPEALRSRVATLLGARRGRSRSPVARRLDALARRGVYALLRVEPETWSRALSPPGIRELIVGSRILDAELPAMNGVFTARALARMYAMLAGGGSLDGVRVLSPATIERASEVQVHGRDQVLGFRMRWRLGYHLVATTRGVQPAAFGHFGYGGSGAWADPSRELSLAMILNRLAGSPVGDLRMARISAAAMACADRIR